MQNIQDLKDKIFSESRNIIHILSGINNVEELISKHSLADDLAEKITFLKLLNKNLRNFENQPYSEKPEYYTSDEYLEEEAIFNNELNEIGSNYPSESENNLQVKEEEAIFNQKINEIIESDLHEELVNFVEENRPEAAADFVSDEISDHLEEEAVFNNELNEIDEEYSDNKDLVLSFVDEERILENAEPEDDLVEEDEVIYGNNTEEKSFTEQLSEADIQEQNQPEISEKIADIFDADHYGEDDLLIEETETHDVSDEIKLNQEEIITENSNVEGVLDEIKKDSHYEEDTSDESDRSKIVDIEKPVSETVRETPLSDQNFENIEAYRNEKKIKLANIRGLKSIQTLFDDDPLEREKENQEDPVVKEDTGSLIKSNIPTDFMEAAKPRPEFRLDLNDRLAFTKVLFGGSQTDLNNAISELNRCKNLEEAKEYLSDLYYDKKWDKVDEYAQRLWLLVENKFM
ncbi:MULTISPECIES: hypothetical protein [Chryseobacterium]|uniref:Uncharacterized protein n=1 Tax=Chryseobacterium taihuense TaxID=1141221 RepID=A0A4U8WDE2_9FLAO|nr:MULTISPECIES: hypothetical protein [Chryseobacterium]QQV02563.1 hypothetical protein I6I61_16100 [Chryseobacterium sp. FDAARGOS 1104]VFB04183.1 Uncharacterised protein [Chryseobacterium taihuense]